MTLPWLGWMNAASMALLFALLSFYPGQGTRFLPAWLRATNLPYVPHVLVAGAMFFWLHRVAVRKRVPQGRTIGAERGEAVVTRVVGAPGSELAGASANPS